MKQDIADELGLRGLLDESDAAESRGVINDVLRKGLLRCPQSMDKKQRLLRWIRSGDSGDPVGLETNKFGAQQDTAAKSLSSSLSESGMPPARRTPRKPSRMDGRGPDPRRLHHSVEDSIE